MLTSISLKNFRSIRDASVKLGQVNLFIGPNNSGKSNFLKGIEFMAGLIYAYPNNQDVSVELCEQNMTRGTEIDFFETPKIQAQLNGHISTITSCEVDYSIWTEHDFIKKNTRNNLQVSVVNTQKDTRELLDLSTAKPSFLAFPRDFSSTRVRLENCVVYKIEPATFEVSVGLSYQPLLEPNGANIANFINTLSQNHERNFVELKRDFASCVGTLVSISTPPDPLFEGNLKLKFFDVPGNSFWAEEVSEGVLYFLALLCLVHQPNPPKLLLLEEPEKGIHPRRIKEVMDFIFELAQMRDIQIILTSHSPYVVDHFADIPECISVFDRKNDETIIRNAGDIITGTNAKLAAEGKKPIRYTDSLGEHWVSGFLGGVPA